MTKLLNNAEHSRLLKIKALIEAARTIDDIGETDRMAAVIQRIPDRDDDELSARLSNAEHAVSDLYNEGEDFAHNAADAIGCIERVLAYRPRRAA